MVVREWERPQASNLAFYINKLEKEEWTKPKANRKKEMIRSREEINKREERKTIKKNQWHQILVLWKYK